MTVTNGYNDNDSANDATRSLGEGPRDAGDVAGGHLRHPLGPQGVPGHLPVDRGVLGAY